MTDAAGECGSGVRARERIAAIQDSLV